jgi:hypothetical protein
MGVAKLSLWRQISPNPAGMSTQSPQPGKAIEFKKVGPHRHLGLGLQSHRGRPCGEPIL